MLPKWSRERRPRKPTEAPRRPKARAVLYGPPPGDGRIAASVTTRSTSASPATRIIAEPPASARQDGRAPPLDRRSATTFPHDTRGVDNVIIAVARTEPQRWWRCRMQLRSLVGSARLEAT